MAATGTTRVTVLGAAGLIGEFIAGDLLRQGFPVVAVARRFTAAQRASFGAAVREAPVAGLGAAGLSALLRDTDMVVNCLGVLQDAGGDSTSDIHEAFVRNLTDAMRATGRPMLLVHLSIPGTEADDRTAFSVTKRNAEHAIAQCGLAYAILRPGFVVAPRAYGGSAMLRALAALPVKLPEALARRPFAAVAIEDIAETVAVLAARWAHGEREHAAAWDLMQPHGTTLGDVVSSFRIWFGGMRPFIPMPMALMRLGALAGDTVASLGWRPPIRSTALAELQRGVAGDPRAWLAATGIAPRALADVLRGRPATVQDKWFARLYLLKPLIVAGLAMFWCVSGLIALTVAYGDAVAILIAHGWTNGSAHVVTVASSLSDIAVGGLIAVRRTSRIGLIAGIVIALGYMAGAALLTPDLWFEPLGALVKTVPAIVLMLVALAIGDDR